ncbi:MAG: hypothetical protein GY849_02150 [Deltaproteobacteria bacterium]|nr:hypothetical protein [Deltaproteobacteria bacterium]
MAEIKRIQDQITYLQNRIFKIQVCKNKEFEPEGWETIKEFKLVQSVTYTKSLIVIEYIENSEIKVELLQNIFI